jgi:hypothetical protein
VLMTTPLAAPNRGSEGSVGAELRATRHAGEELFGDNPADRAGCLKLAVNSPGRVLRRTVARDHTDGRPGCTRT